MQFQKSTLMGLFTADQQALVNPPMDRVIAAGDQVIVIAEDDDTVVLTRAAGIVPAEQRETCRPATAAPERTLLLGWNVKGETIVRELDNYVAAGSVVTMVAHRAGGGNVQSLAGASCKRQTMRSPRATRRTGPRSSRLAARTSSTTSSCSATPTLDMQEADARTLITLLHLRKHRSETGGGSASSAKCSTCATATWPRSPRPTTSSSATS